VHAIVFCATWPEFTCWGLTSSMSLHVCFSFDHHLLSFMLCDFGCCAPRVWGVRSATHVVTLCIVIMLSSCVFMYFILCVAVSQLLTSRGMPNSSDPHHVCASTADFIILFLCHRCWRPAGHLLGLSMFRILHMSGFLCPSAGCIFLRGAVPWHGFLCLCVYLWAIDVRLSRT